MLSDKIDIINNTYNVYDLSESVKKKIQDIREYNIGITFYPGSNINRLHLLLDSLINKPVNELWLEGSSVVERNSRYLFAGNNTKSVNVIDSYLLKYILEHSDEIPINIDESIELNVESIENCFNTFKLYDDIYDEILKHLQNDNKEKIKDMFKKIFNLAIEENKNVVYSKILDIMANKVDINEYEININECKLLNNDIIEYINDILKNIYQINQDEEEYMKTYNIQEGNIKIKNIKQSNDIHLFSYYIYNSIKIIQKIIDRNINYNIVENVLSIPECSNILSEKDIKNIKSKLLSIFKYFIINTNSTDYTSTYIYYSSYKKSDFEKYYDKYIDKNFKDCVDKIDDVAKKLNQLRCSKVKQYPDFKKIMDDISKYIFDNEAYKKMCKSIKYYLANIYKKIQPESYGENFKNLINKLICLKVNNGNIIDKINYIKEDNNICSKAYDTTKVKFGIWKYLQNEEHTIDDLFIYDITNLKGQDIINHFEIICDYIDNIDYTKNKYNYKNNEQLFKYYVYYNEKRCENKDEEYKVYMNKKLEMEIDTTSVRHLEIDIIAKNDDVTKNEKILFETIFKVEYEYIKCIVTINKLTYYSNYNKLKELIMKYSNKLNHTEKTDIDYFENLYKTIDNEINKYYNEHKNDDKYNDIISNVIYDEALITSNLTPRMLININKYCPYDRTLKAMINLLSIEERIKLDLCIDINNYGDYINRTDFIILDDIPIFRRNILKVEKCEHIKDIKLHFIEDGIDNPNYKKEQVKIKEEIQKFYNKYERDFKNIYTYGSKYHTSVMTSRMLFYRKTQYEYSIVCDDDDIAVNGIDVYYDLFEKVRKKFVVDNFLAFSHAGCIVNNFDGKPSLFGMWAMVMLPNSHNIEQSINNMCGEDSRCITLSCILPYYDYDKTFYMYLWASNQGYSKSEFNKFDYEDYTNLYLDIYCCNCYNIEKENAYYNGNCSCYKHPTLYNDDGGQLDYRYDAIIEIKNILENVGMPYNIYDSNRNYSFMSTRPIVPTFNLYARRFLLHNDKLYDFYINENDINKNNIMELFNWLNDDLSNERSKRYYIRNKKNDVVILLILIIIELYYRYTKSKPNFEKYKWLFKGYSEDNTNIYYINNKFYACIEDILDEINKINANPNKIHFSTKYMKKYRHLIDSYSNIEINKYKYSDKILLFNELYDIFKKYRCFDKCNININNIYDIIFNPSTNYCYFNEIFIYIFYNNIDGFIETGKLKLVDNEYLNNLFDGYNIDYIINPIENLNKYLYFNSNNKYDKNHIIKEYKDSKNESKLKYDNQPYLFYNPTRFVLGGKNENNYEKQNQNKNIFMYVLLIVLIIILIVLIIIKIRNKINLKNNEKFKNKINYINE